MPSVRWKRVLPPLGVIVACVPLFALAETSLSYLSTLVGESGAPFWWSFRRMLVPWTGLAVLLPVPLLLARRLPLGGARALHNGLIHAAASVAVGVTHLFLDVAIWRLIDQAPQPLFHLTAMLISRYMLQDVFLYWTVVGGLQVVWHQRSLRARMLSDARLHAELAEARLAALQARLEPHFLFNTLNTAVMLVRDDRRNQAVEVLVELSELLRVVVRDAPSREVPLEEEWAFITRYLALEQARFGERLQVELDPDDTLLTEPVPFLILQPLVENAIRHGIAQLAGTGQLRVTARREGARLRLEVRDNGLDPGSTAASRVNGHGVGLTNIRARLKELYGDRAELRVERSEGATVATVWKPLARADGGVA